MASQCFALAVRLIPLERGVPNPDGMSAALVKSREKERGFLEQLLDGSKIEKFEPLVPIKVHHICAMDCCYLAFGAIVIFVFQQFFSLVTLCYQQRLVPCVA